LNIQKNLNPQKNSPFFVVIYFKKIGKFFVHRVSITLSIINESDTCSVFFDNHQAKDGIVKLIVEFVVLFVKNLLFVKVFPIPT